MTRNSDPCRLPLVETVAATHERARTALDRPDRGMDAVVWLSAHLAAMERVVYPIATANLPPEQSALDRQRRLSLRMQRVLRRLEELWAGDALARTGSSDRLRHELALMMAEHEQLEGALLARLSTCGLDEAGVDLAERYRRALRHGPTRPHPHGPRRGRLGRFVYAFDAARDHLLDVLDSRHVPLPRPPQRHRPPGRWGQYLLGRGDVADQRPTEDSTQHSDQSTSRRQP